MENISQPDRQRVYMQIIDHGKKMQDIGTYESGFARWLKRELNQIEDFEEKKAFLTRTYIRVTREYFQFKNRRRILKKIQKEEPWLEGDSNGRTNRILHADKAANRQQRLLNRMDAVKAKMVAIKVDNYKGFTGNMSDLPDDVIWRFYGLTKFVSRVHLSAKNSKRTGKISKMQ